MIPPGVLGRPPALPWDGSVPINGVTDGNSIFDNHGAAMTMAAVMAEGALGTAIGATWNHAAMNGETWANVRAGGALVDQMWNPSAANVLLVLEHTNTVTQHITGGGDVAGALAACVAGVTGYVRDRLDAKPWRVVLVGAPPMGQTGTTYAAINTALSQANAWCRDNWAAIGAAGYVDIRTGSTFLDHDGSDLTRFSSQASLWFETAPVYVHPTTAGKRLMRDQSIIPSLRRLPRR